MLGYEFLRWWYGPGWAGVSQRLRRRLSGLAEMFSVHILARTLFAPWRRIITYPGSGLGPRLRAVGDNMVSRVVGFSVRLLVLVAAAVSAIGIGIAGLIALMLWPLLPCAAIGLIVWGLL